MDPRRGTLWISLEFAASLMTSSVTLLMSKGAEEEARDSESGKPKKLSSLIDLILVTFFKHKVFQFSKWIKLKLDISSKC